MTAKTPKGRVVTVTESAVGTRCREGHIAYGDVQVAYYCNTGSQIEHSLEEGLVAADSMIDTCGLTDT